MKTPLVSVIIINWNGEKYLNNCLKSILEQDYHSLELLFVDNNSIDNSVPFVRKKFNQVRLIENNSNIGYSGAANVGIKASTGEYILLLNPDIVLEKFFILKLVETMGREEVGFASGKLYRTSNANNDQNVLDSTGHIIYKNRRVIDRGQDETDFGQYDQEINIFGVCGAAAMFKRKMLDNISIDGEYFDEDFFAYKEDVDICWRANIYGWHGKFNSDAIAFHYRGWKPGKRDKVSEFVRYHSIKNRYLMLLKNDFLRNVMIDFPRIFINDLAVFIYLILREPKALKAYLTVLKLLPKMFKKRRIIMKNKKIISSQFRRWIK